MNSQKDQAFYWAIEGKGGNFSASGRKKELGGSCRCRRKKYKTSHKKEKGGPHIGGERRIREYFVSSLPRSENSRASINSIGERKEKVGM